eukprot:CAMPEP_0170273968 /NCGR_PEP_ID=MMETSP0116_2-20130129/36954_1 /TAXON_ID=400756 /ORGANISM="Durinskia baltica, Strain CSIRO CS-38" /LENGTH=81 /DNA_ID=CAMNT_0010525211 /DNA_START=71 /DNA_END=314 /DNA_ORIENTATION=+
MAQTPAETDRLKQASEDGGDPGDAAAAAARRRDLMLYKRPCFREGPWRLHETPCRAWRRFKQACAFWPLAFTQKHGLWELD